VTVLDGHVTIGESRDASLSVEQLLATMDRLGIDRALVAPAEPFVPIRNREGNELTARAAAESAGRLLAYAIATPWLGGEAVDELRRARERGARALKLDPALQGFDLLDGQVEPLVAFAVEAGWPVYVRTGTPPHALPLQVAWLASRFPEGSFLLGKSGATDFSHDGPATLAAAPNVYADSVYVEWPTALAAADPEGRGGRVFFTTDAPFGDPAIELARAAEAPYSADVRAAVLGGTLARLLGL
jgi:predicted TIM-barrel fold metal-dependent hydrolase